MFAEFTQELNAEGSFRFLSISLECTKDAIFTSWIALPASMIRLEPQIQVQKLYALTIWVLDSKF